jgi:SAM-dependent methyltransferase
VSESTYYLDPTLYDAIYSDYTADIASHVDRVRSAGGPSLEVCCGNGRLLIPALEAGLRCDGLDWSKQMLDDLRDKLAARGLSTGVFEADMRDFSLPNRYALVTIGFNSFLHNLTQESQLATLRCCRMHLEPGGRLEVMIFHPSAEKLIEWAGGEKFLKEVPHAGGRLRVYDRASDDRIEQVRRMTRRIEMLDSSGRVTREERLTFDLRYVYKPEMELLLRVAGFSRHEMRPLFSNYADPASDARGRPAREGDFLLWTAWA